MEAASSGSDVCTIARWSVIRMRSFISAALILCMTSAAVSAYDGPAHVESAEWFKYKSDNFSVCFPSEPRVGTMMVTSDGVVHNGMALGLERDRTAYILSCVEFAGGAGLSIDDLPEVLRSAREGKVLNKKDLRLQGYDGREYTIQNGRGTLIHRTYIINRWVYQLAVQTRRIKDARRNINKFFESFHVERRPDNPVASSSSKPLLQGKLLSRA